MARYLSNGVKERERLLEAEIVIGELISNAFRHSTGPICADLQWTDASTALVVIHDGGPCFDERPLPEDRFAESGRGMHIIRALADDVHIRRIKPRGCMVAATLPLTRR